MKTLLQNINSLLSVLFAAKVLIYKNSIINHLIEINYTKYLAAFTIMLNNPGHYLLPLSNQVIKAVLGYDLELELLITVFAGYFLLAKRALTHNALIQRITRATNHTSYYNPQKGLQLLS
jgi:hypothetical protein